MRTFFDFMSFVRKQYTEQSVNQDPNTAGLGTLLYRDNNWVGTYENPTVNWRGEGEAKVSQYTLDDTITEEQAKEIRRLRKERHTLVRIRQMAGLSPRVTLARIQRIADGK